MRNKMRESDVKRKSFIQTIADFVQNILPSNTPLSRGSPKSELSDFIQQLSKPISLSIRTDTDTVTASRSTPFTSREIVDETPKTLDLGETDGEGDEAEFTEGEVRLIRH